jgi:hypothetical protein
MTSLQDARIKEFEIEARKRRGNAVIDWKESNSSESRGIIFADVDGITLMVYLDGLISIPAVRTYHPPRYSTPIIAAALATELWTKQKARDDANPDLAKSRRTGHLGPIVELDLECRNKVCPCHGESPAIRQSRARGGFNWNPDQCS